MKTDNGESRSVWMATPETRAEPQLALDIEADVCIVGAGIAGMTTGYLLSLENQRVVVLDDGPVAGGETCRTTAHLVNAPDNWFTEVERLHGKRASRLAAESHTAAIDLIEDIVRREKIRCDFLRLDGYLYTEPGESAETLEKELEAAREAGLRDVELVERVPIDSFETGAALRFPQQGQFHVLAYIKGLADGHERPRQDEQRGHHSGARRRRRHQLARQRSPRHTHEAGPVPHLRHRSARRTRLRSASPPLGHRRPLPLRAPAAGGTRARHADRRGRGPQDGTGGRHGQPLPPPRKVDPRALPESGKGRVPLVGAGDGAC